ncbi:alpha-L-fucosidase-domain-containing protein [Pyrenochaeta sp. MPI-SDFR-AT-0127]|nr:alpha-L-fucosidase-domain-containing protein [Pyrenochaeta sp. MPI-SDFR-AT-0127]
MINWSILTSIYTVCLYVDPAVASIGTDASENLLPGRSNNSPPQLRLLGGTLTSKWFEGTKFVQVLELAVENTGSDPLTLADTLNVTAVSDFFDVVQSATLARLTSQQVAVVQLGIRNKPNVAPGQQCSGTITATYGERYGVPLTISAPVTGICGIGDYAESADSLSHHWNPEWFNEVKYGIFIHWGLYSVPAYGGEPPVYDYAEWYWYHMKDPNYKTKTYQYHRDTYGENFNYDDFMGNFTAQSFDAKEWVDLIADAGARYMVPVTKHHDGFALYNFSTAISKRSSIWYGPKRDFLAELFAAAKQYQPQIKRGTYFSMPEWFNPKNTLYGGTFGGGPPKNPYTGNEIPYTGYVEVDDFVKDIQLPQMRTLAYVYETEIIWCDIGGPNNMTIFAAEWLNWARNQGRQVTFNNRCGLTGDFDTPEYTTNPNIVRRKWETNRGMDTFSYGYNHLSPDSTYMTGKDIVISLIDAVSKNGNLLLDIGPKGDGSIPAIMKDNLRDAGTWIKAHGESVFGTRYWSVKPGSDPFRYTTKEDAFYIHFIGTPPSTLSVMDQVPYLPGDTVTIVGGSKHGTPIPVTWNGPGTLKLALSDDILTSDKYIWTFKITYTGD